MYWIGEANGKQTKQGQLGNFQDLLDTPHNLKR